jgi:hypothetical protein
MGQVTVTGGLTDVQLRASAVTVGGTVTANVGQILVKNDLTGSITSGYLPVGNSSYSGQSGAVMVMGGADDGAVPAHLTSIFGLTFPISGTVTIGSALPTGTNRIGVVTIGAGTVTIGAGTSQIGSVTASISNFPATQAVSLTTLPALVAGTAQIGSVTVGNTVTIAGTVTANPTGTQTIAGSVTLGASTSQIGSVTASISNSLTISSLPDFDVQISNGLRTFNQTEGSFVVAVSYAEPITGTVTANTFAVQGTTVTNSNFTSTTASTTLVSAVAGRDVLTVFNEGAGNLFISAGATATTISYQVRLSAGDYWECPEGQRSLIHTAVFATAGTARVTEVS